MRISFRLKTVLGVAIIEAIFLSILIFNNVRLLSSSHENELTYRTQTLADVFSRAVSDAVLSMDLATLNALVNDLLESQEVSKVVVANAQTILSDRVQSDKGVRLINTTMAQADIRINDTVFGYVQIWLDSSYVNSVVQDAVRQSIQIAVVEIFLVALASIALGGYLTAQLTRLRQGIVALRAGNFETEPAARIPDDELGDTYRDFIEFKTALTQANQQQQAMLDQVSQLAKDNSRKEAWLKAITNQLADGLIAFDVQGSIHYANHAAITLFGYEDRPFIGLSIFDLPFSDVQKQRLTHFIESGPQSTLWESLNRHRNEVLLREDGSAFTASMTLSYLRIDVHDYFILSLADLSWRKDHERQMIVGDAIRSGILESSISAVIAIDMQGKIIEFNRSAEQLFGYKRTDVLKKDMAELIMPLRFRDAHNRGLKHFLTTGEGPVLRKRIEITAMSSDYLEFPIELAITPVDTPEGPIFTAVIDDISERIESTKKLERAKEQADRANREKSRFLASMSHEIRTPLNIILGMVDLLQNTTLDQRQRHYALSAENAGRNLLDMINDVLDLSKIEAGKMELKATDFNPVQVFEETALMFKQRCWSKKLNLFIHVANNIPQKIFLDASFFRQIISNLLANAINYTDHGHIIARLALTQVNTIRHLSVAIEDTGPGLSESAQQELFQEYSQVHTSEPKKTKGTGLGLVICRELANLCGGDITLKSELGVGSIFAFELPLIVEPVLDNSPPFQNVRCALLTQNVAWYEHFGWQFQEWGMAVTMVEEASRLDALSVELCIVDCDSLPTAMIDQNGAVFDTIKTLFISEQNHHLRWPVSESVHHLKPPVSPTSLQEAIRRLLLGEAPPAIADVVKPNRLDMNTSARVLLVDDSDANRVIVATYLNDMGIDVIEADNGETAIATLKHQVVDLVLMDLRMPVLGGLEAAQRIRAEHLADQVPIIALTAHAIADARDECLAAGMQDFLTKPIERRALYDTLVAWLGDLAESQSDDSAGRTVPAITLPAKTDEQSSLVFDTAAIDQLVADTSEAAVQRMLAIFYSECERRVEMIKESISEGSIDGVEVSAHALKSSAKTFGAMRLSDLARAMEAACKANEEPLAMHRVNALAALVRQTLETMQASLAARWTSESSSKENP